MPDAEPSTTTTPADTDAAVAPVVRKRPKPGERRVQILEALATMLEQPGAERITTAALAARLEVSEAALYRHFASKAQMFEGLIEFIEQTVFSLVNQITERADEAAGAGTRQAAKIVAMLLQFGEKNPGMTRVMVGDALVFENDRLQQRMNQFFDKIEATLRQCLRDAAQADGAAAPSVQAQVSASLLTAFVVGRLQRFARSGFKRMPSEHLEASLALML
jgi:TetR/AcrR family transcriptional regulator